MSSSTVAVHEDELEEIEKVIDGSLKAAERLRAVQLGNADEPSTVFEARSRPRVGPMRATRGAACVRSG